LEEENRLMLDQLHRVQEELEQYYLRNKELEEQLSRKGVASFETGGSVGWDDEALKLMAEKVRLEEMLSVQKELQYLEREQSPQGRIGNIFVEGARNGESILTIFKKLRVLRKQWRQKTPPVQWGGHGYPKLLAAYDS